jgi:hypothetical protein
MLIYLVQNFDLAFDDKIVYWEASQMMIKGIFSNDRNRSLY